VPDVSDEFTCQVSVTVVMRTVETYLFNKKITSRKLFAAGFLGQPLFLKKSIDFSKTTLQLDIVSRECQSNSDAR
jgi:hypothetical protein